VRANGQIESNIEWIGLIPSTWKTSKLGFVATVKARLGWKGLKAEEYIENEDGYVFLSTPNIKGCDIDFEVVNYITEHRYLESPEIMLQAGDVLVAKDGSTLGICNVVRQLPRPSTVNSSIAVLRPRPQCQSVYLYYYFQSHTCQSTIQRMKDGMGVPHLFQADLRKFGLLLPPIEEQRAIADYLDLKTAEIDALIAGKRRMIDLLHEKRQALISEAVTKGLDPDVPMKDSGFPWLGEVPAHWPVERLRWRLRSIGQGWSPQCESRKAEPGEWGVLKVGCMNSGVFDESENKALPPELDPLPDLEVRIGDVLMSRSNTVDLVGAVGMVHQTQGQILLCDKLYRLDFNQSMLLSSYSVHLLRSRAARLQIERDATGASSSMKNISNEVVANMVFAFPSIEEQRCINEFIDHELLRMGDLERTISTQINRLLEYRRTLISATVTGKLVVPMEVAP